MIKSKRKKAKRDLIPRLIISLPSLIFWLAVAAFDRSLQTAAALIAALLHEGGHAAVIGLCGIRITGVTVLPYGLEMTTDRPPYSFYEEIAVNAAGCAVNLLTCPLFHLIGNAAHGDLGYFFHLLSASSLTLGILNAFPIVSLDGGCVLDSALSIFLSSDTAYRTVRAVSFVFLILLWILATYVFMFSGYNYSLFAMCVWLFARIFIGQL